MDKRATPWIDKPFSTERQDTMVLQDFERALGTLPQGYCEGTSSGRRYGLTLRRSKDGRRIALFARELSGKDVISFNFYKTRGGKSSLNHVRCPAKR